MKQWDITFFCRNFSLSEFLESFIGNASLFQENCGGEKLVWMREGDITFFRRVFFVSHYGKIFLGTLPRSRIFPVAKTFNGCEGGYHVFPWKKFSITVPESFIGNASWFEKVSGIWRNKWTKRGVSQISIKILVSYYRKNFWELFGVSKNFWQRKICMDERSGYHVFRSKFFKSQYRRNSLANLRRFRNFLVWEEKYE